jgi:hypothetical protein
VRDKDRAAIRQDHDANILMFDVPAPFSSRGIDAYRVTWETFFVSSEKPVTFHFTDVEITAGSEVAFVTAELVRHGNGRAECISLTGVIDLEATAREHFGACRDGLFMLFNEKRIAKRGHSRTRAWLPLDPSWIVTSIDSGDILVQHDDDEGVVVSLRWGGK